MIDTGIDQTLPDLQGRISPQSTDIRSSRNDPTGVSRHGTRVAAVAAANFDNAGSLGVAYGSTILSIRADDTVGSACGPDGCQFNDSDLARAIDYAVSNGAKVINLSLGGDTPDGAAFEAALQRAVAAGVVVAAAAGNDTTPNPEWPARYAADSRFAGSVMAVGAMAQDGSMASFSGRAGVAANGFLVAPGQGVATDCTSAGCWSVSGTSFASPIVAGSLALLLQAFPMISGRDAVDILFRTATDKGDPGTDPIWGRGLLNLKAAFQPVGALNVPSAAGGTFQPNPPPGGIFGSAFGDAVRTSAALKTFGRDDYRRIFTVDLAQTFPEGRHALMGAAAPAARSTATSVAGPAGTRFSVRAEQPVFEEAVVPERMYDFAGVRQPSSALVSADIGRLSLTAWRGEGGAVAPGAGDRDAFRTVASADQVMKAAVRLGGGWSLAAEQGSAEQPDILALREVEGTDYASATASFSNGRYGFSVTGGRMDEPLGPLGSFISERSIYSLPAETRFGAFSLTARASDRLTLRGDAAFGRTSIRDGFFQTGDAFSSQWRLGAYGDCTLLGAIPCDTFAIELEQPLRIESGTFSAVLADTPLDWRDPTTFSTRRFSASPSGREIDLRLVMDRDFGGWGLLRLRTIAAFNQGHREDRDLDLGAALDWRVTF
nr:S8 family peptidase [Caulobacter mirabilis]